MNAMQDTASPPEETPEESLICSNCDNRLGAGQTYCSRCGYPENGTEDEQKQFMYKIKSREEWLQEAGKKVRNARYILIGLAVLVSAVGAYFLLSKPDASEALLVGIQNVILGVIYAGLVFWARTKPFEAFLTALIVYGLIIALNAIIEPATLAQGVLIKVIVIGALVKGLQSARDYTRLKSELATLKGEDV